MSYWRKDGHSLKDGPWAGERIYLDATSDGATGWVLVNGILGRYVRGKFQRHPQQPEKKGTAP